MTPEAFIREWQGVALKESASTKEHFDSDGGLLESEARAWPKPGNCAR